MKKVLMVMGFALCASVAFAQTARISYKEDVLKQERTPVNVAKTPVDYKASIFAKANGHDTICVYKIDVASDYAIANVTSTDRINDTVVGNANAHSVSGDANKWMRFSSINDFLTNAASRLEGLTDWLTPHDQMGNPTGEPRLWYITEDIDPSVSPREPNDDGFMIVSYNETSASSGIFNTYFTMPSVTRPTDAVMIEVSLTQSYRKYYDKCYIDYQVGNTWYAREVNVTGIDCSVNGWGANKVRYVMPTGLNDQTNITLRLRAWSNHRGSAFGYFWAVDNIAVMKLTERQLWALNGPLNIDGFYGMIPQGMSIPITYGVNAQNLSIDDIPNAKVTLRAGTDHDNLTPAITGTPITISAGNFDAVYPLILNERGFFNTEEEVHEWYQSWLYSQPTYGSANITGYPLRGLPVTTAGKNFYNINVAGGNLNRDYDTILYYVSEMQNYDYAQTGRESGYRWAHENGVISSNSSFLYALNDAGYVVNDGSDGHVYDAGYAVMSRFITGNNIPQGWVFRGLELITATDREADNLEGASIVPITYVDNYEDGSLGFMSMACGIDGLAFEVSENDINDQLYENGGYILPNAGYKAINIQFAEQPAIEPNTAYRFGYRLNDDALFALAAGQNTFKFINDTMGVVNVGYGYTGANDTNAYAPAYAAAAAGAHDYRFQFAPATALEVLVADPIQGSYIDARNIHNYPMVRPIVGPARPVEHASIGADCDNNVEGQGADVDHGVMVSRASDEICDRLIEVAAGSQQRIVFEPMGDHSVIDSVLLDGVALTPYNEDAGEGDYYAYDYDVIENEGQAEEFVLLEREYWVYIMSDLQPNSEHVFEVYSHWEAHNTHPVGIDPVAPESYLTLAPNPATSSVKLNVNGVSGMVNCSILDMSGRVVYNANINAENEHIVNVSNFPAGAYFVRVTNDTFSKIEKLIVK